MTGICQVQAVRDYERQVADERARWWVRCRVCPPTADTLSFLDSMMGAGERARLGWAPTWDLAMRYADAHASLHADRACPTCQHVPDTPVSQEDTQLLMQVRR